MIAHWQVAFKVHPTRAGPPRPLPLHHAQELCSGGNLSDALRSGVPHGLGGEARLAQLFRGIVKSVLHCHQVRARVRSGVTIFTCATVGR